MDIIESDDKSIKNENQLIKKEVKMLINAFHLKKLTLKKDILYARYETRKPEYTLQSFVWCYINTPRLFEKVLELFQLKLTQLLAKSTKSTKYGYC